MIKPRFDWRAVFDLGAAEAARLVLSTVVPAVLAVQAVTRLASYVSPRLGRSDLLLSRVQQEETALLCLTLLVLAGWMARRLSDLGPLGARLARSLQSVVADLLALGITIAAASLLWLCFSLDRISALYGLRMAAASLLASSSLAVLAPGLVRLPASVPVIAGTTVVVLAGALGFLGPWFPLRADTVLDAGGSWARGLADVLATAACFLVSVGIAQRR